eukprot:COSAG02_NODE_4211_length_5625_cov_8.798950_5_plen_233_part_00
MYRPIEFLSLLHTACKFISTAPSPFRWRHRGGRGAGRRSSTDARPVRAVRTYVHTSSDARIVLCQSGDSLGIRNLRCCEGLLKVLIDNRSRYAAEDAEPAKGIKVEKLEGWNGRKPPVIRCTTTIAASVPRPLWSALMDDLELRQVWDDACAVTHRIATFGGDDLASGRSMNHTQTKPVLGGLVSPREFVSFGVERALAGGNTFINVSVPAEHHDYPEYAPTHLPTTLPSRC